MERDQPITPQTPSRVDAILASGLPPIERLMARVFGPKLCRALTEFLVFGIKQAWACLFGGLMLAGLFISDLIWQPDWALARYDALVFYAVGLQLAFIASGLERPREALVILIFHIVGTAMELFKTASGSWAYPEESLLRIGNVPLFSGFLYAAVGSYFARVTRVFDFRFTAYPRRRWTLLIAVAAYLNFFTHHYLPDLRWVLFGAAVLVFGQTVVHYSVWRWQHRMPLLLGFALVALFIWFAENIGTLAGAWIYPDQAGVWRPVSISKFGAWFLLMMLSWVLVTVIHRPKARPASETLPRGATQPLIPQR